MRLTTRAAAAAAIALPVLAAPIREAHAWVEAHVEADDVKVVVERSGDARIEHRITLRIAGGPLRSLDLRGVDADAVPGAGSYVVPQREASRGSLGSALEAVVERMPLETKPRPDGSPPPTVLRVRFDTEKGLGRGIYVIAVSYTTHLTPRFDPAGGPLAHLTWRGPVWEDGFDSARVTFDLPAAPTEPRADDAGDPSDPGVGHAPLVLSTVRRGAMRDQIELLRPYAPKSEAITWAVRADARVLRAPAPASAPRNGVRQKLEHATAGAASRGLLMAAAFALFAVYSSLVAWKSTEVARAARARGTAARPLVPIPAALRAVLAGAALVAGLFVELVLARAMAGAVLVALAVALAVHRTPRWPRASLRRPGRWLPVTETAAFVAPPRPTGAYLDVSTLAGKALLLVSLTAVGAAAAWMFETSPYRAELIGFDAVAILAVFCTGRIKELPPDAATAPARFFAEVAKRIKKALPDGRVRILGRLRVPEGESTGDELRLAVVPRNAPRGFGAIEVGVVYVRGAGGSLALPEVLLRVKTGTACDGVADGLARHGRSARGRSANERTILLSPRLPTARMTAGLVVSLVRAMEPAVADPRARAPGRGSGPTSRRAA